MPSLFCVFLMVLYRHEKVIRISLDGLGRPALNMMTEGQGCQHLDRRDKVNRPDRKSVV